MREEASLVTEQLTFRSDRPQTGLLCNRKMASMPRKKRILIVDDDTSFTRLLKLNLEQTNLYAVRVENKASRALATAREFLPDLMLLDVMMPEMDGGDLAALAQADPVLKSIPIVFLTAAVERKEVGSHGRRIGGLPFLAKPADLKEVMGCIEKYARP